jgi:hypothetical protein
MGPNISGHINTFLGIWVRNSKGRDIYFETLTAGTSAWPTDGGGG